MNIEYWSDYACPYCYIGETHLKKALQDLNIDDAEIKMNAFELNPSAPTEYEGPTAERFAVKYGLSLGEATARIDSISQAGRDAGLDFEYAQTRYTNTMDAHRLTKLAANRLGNETADMLSGLLYDAYFGKGKELSNKDVLTELGTQVGLDKTEILELLDGDEYTGNVRTDEAHASSMGVHAVPYFVINGKYAVPGAMPVEEFKKILARAEADENTTPTNGMTCGPNGCMI